jgi:hypothetical protein
MQAFAKSQYVLKVLAMILVLYEVANNDELNDRKIEQLLNVVEYANIAECF